jgi:hypothetical protein
VVSRARLLLLPLALLVVGVLWSPARAVLIEAPDVARSCSSACAPSAIEAASTLVGTVATHGVPTDVPGAPCIRSVECAGAAGASVALALAVVVVAGLARPTDGVPLPVHTATRLRSGRQPNGGIYRPPRPGAPPL